MQRLANILLVAGGVFLTGNTTQANLISNGSFEFFITGPNDQDFGGYVRSFSPPLNADITSWIINGTSIGSADNLDLVHNSFYPAFSGNESLDMSGREGAAGVISQSFATIPGVIYDLSFAYANNPDGPGAMANALVTGSSVLLNQDVSHNGATRSNMNYLIFSQNFVADSSITTLQFSSLTNSGFGIALDAVDVESTIAVVREPATAAILGIALLGTLTLFRRQRLIS